MMKEIKIFPHNPMWSLQYKEQSEIIKSCLGDEIHDVCHIGSTSISDLYAKDSIDILLVVNKLHDSLKLTNIGYTFKGELNIPLRFYFSKNDNKAKVNLHVCEPDHSFIKLNINFRDYLRNNKSYMQEYNSLKLKLLESKDPSFRIRGFISNYGRGKDSFIKKVLDLSGFKDYILNFCLHDNEVSAAKDLLQDYIRENNIINHSLSDEINIDLDMNKHLVLYCGIDIVGYAQCELKNKEDATIHVLLAKTKAHTKELNRYVNKWLTMSGYTNISYAY